MAEISKFAATQRPTALSTAAAQDLSSGDQRFQLGRRIAEGTMVQLANTLSLAAVSFNIDGPNDRR